MTRTVSFVGLVGSGAAGRVNTWPGAAGAGTLALSRVVVTTPLAVSARERDGGAEVSAPLPRCPAAPRLAGFFMKIAGATAMAIINRMAQMVRRSMLSSQH